MARSAKQVRSTEDIAKGILVFGQTIDAYQRTLSRLKGIYAGVGKSESSEKLNHRVRSILGYRKKCAKVARELQAAFTAFDEVLAELEG